MGLAKRTSLDYDPRMPVTDTPLRYPGGKSQLMPLVVDLLKRNKLIFGEYAEPFAGGAGLAVSLLVNAYVSRVYLNDVDPAVHAFWHCVLHHTDALCERIETTQLDMREWRRQREIFLDPSGEDVISKGFATLFLNRTNRSGILRAGVIGGNGQSGAYKLDCRFNRVELVRKVRRIASYREQISLSRLDAAEFLHHVVPTTSRHTLVNLDPPYFGKGPELYTNFYQPSDHAALAAQVGKLRRRWIVTYDDAPEIRKLYARFPMYSSKLNYSAQVKRTAAEILVVDPALSTPETLATASIQPHQPLAA